MDLLDPLGTEVDVVLETSHNRQARGHSDLYREHIDLPVLKSILYEYEDLLVNDGCTGIAVLNPNIPQEVQFDEHKLLIVYGNQLEAYEQVLASRNVFCNDKMKFVTEAEHVHSSSEQYAELFESSRSGWAWTPTPGSRPAPGKLGVGHARRSPSFGSPACCAIRLPALRLKPASRPPRFDAGCRRSRGQKA